MRHNPAYGIMAHFVQRSAVPIDGFEIGLRRRHLHVVMGGHVERAVTADAKIDAGGGDQCLDTRFDQIRRHRRCRRRDILRQVFALIGVEDGEALDERDFLGVLAGLARTALLRGGPGRLDRLAALLRCIPVADQAAKIPLKKFSCCCWACGDVGKASALSTISSRPVSYASAGVRPSRAECGRAVL